MRPTQGWEGRLHQQYRLNQLLPAWAPDAVLAAVLLAGSPGTELPESPSHGGTLGTEGSHGPASSPGGPATPPRLSVPSSRSEAGAGRAALRSPGNPGGCPVGPIGGSPEVEQESGGMEGPVGPPSSIGFPETNSAAAFAEVGRDASAAGAGKRRQAGMARPGLSAGGTFSRWKRPFHFLPFLYLLWRWDGRRLSEW